ncbi:GIY-YIG nuclease family protein [bacterium]|mgnify:CR=1 FL=1|nr:MAG: GIY-YIG nuclease family protein [bacterium]
MRYIVLLYLENSRWIKIGKLGRFYFKEGYYLYVGSGGKNPEKRVERHKKKKKKKRWHIDCLTEFTEFVKVWWFKEGEEEIARKLAERFEIPVKGFGSSDKKSPSHLFYAGVKINSESFKPL